MALRPSSGRHRLHDDQSSHRDPPVETTSHLLHRARSGDNRALEVLCARYLPRLNRWARGRLPPRCGGSVDTDDLVQESLVRTLDRLESFEPEHPGAFEAYLRMAIVNRIRNEVRKVSVAPHVTDLDGREPDRAPSPLEHTIGHDAYDHFERALAGLGEDDRAIIFLRFELEMTHEEVARSLSKPSSDAARKSVSRAIVRLAKEMTVEYGI